MKTITPNKACFAIAFLLALFINNTVFSQCTSNGNGSDGYLTLTRQVIFNTINNSTPNVDNAYSDFTSISTNVTQSSSYNLTVNVNTDGNYTVHTLVWIDWNQDNDFLDAGETYDMGTATNVLSGSTSLSPLSVTIPGTATLGSTTMRVSTKYNSDPTSCETGFDGEVEDYTVTVVSPSAPEINIQGNGTSIADGDNTPSASDDTDFGNVDVTVGTNPNTFTIQNTGTAALNLTAASPYVVISGVHAADFTLTANPSTPIATSGSTTFTITFNPSALGLRTANVSIANNDSDENPYNFDIQGTGTTTVQEINVTGLGNNILTPDLSPSATDGTDFGSVVTAAGTSVSSFIIENLGTVNPLLLTGGSPYVAISGTHAADFAVTTIPSNSIAASSNTTFDITFDPSADGLRQATVTIANNDADEGSYTYSIQGTGFTPPPCGQTVVHTADFETNWDGWTDGGVDAQRVSNGSRSYSNTYSLEIRNNDIIGNNSSVLTPLFDFNGYDKVDFKFFFTSYSNENLDNFFVEFSNDSGSTWTVLNDFICNDVVNKDADYESGTSIYFYSKTVTMFNTVHTFPAGNVSQIRVRADGGDTTDVLYIDNVTITGTQYCVPTNGPGGITSDLDLWLRADKVDGITIGTDGANVSKWTDNGKGNHAETVVSGQEPVYRNNATNNINFNPVIDFENDNTTAAADMTYLTARDELMATSGFNSNDIFMVVIPDQAITTAMYPLDTFTSSDPLSTTAAEDVTGFGFGGYTQRLTNEYFTYCIGTSSEPTPGTFVGYGCGDLTGTNNYNQFNIINVRHNSTNTDMEIYLNANAVTTTVNDLPSYAAVNNRKYFLGRSQYWNGSFGGRIAEVITYDSRKTDGNTERNRIESYLALKYGITLGTNGTSIDYVDSNGNTVWDINTGVPVEDVFNYNIAGIFRDDTSNHSQKQSKTYNTSNDITIGLGDIYATNSANTNTFGSDRMYLTWGNDNGTLAAQAPVIVDMSAGIGGLTTNVQFTSIGRTWKVVENGGDIGNTKVSIPESMLSTTLSPPGSYLMFISDSPTFSPTSDYRVMTLNGSDLETEYNFNTTKFITFGYAEQTIVERSVYFDGIQDYIDVENHLDLNTTAFTISSWIKRDTGTTNASIASKRNYTNTEGYDLRIDGSGRLAFTVNGAAATLTSSVVIPENEWHQVAVIYDSGTATLYIDGVADTSSGLPSPIATSQKFLIAAVDGYDPNTTDYFAGNIDEVRIWDIALTPVQLRYIMNQEIIDSSVLPTPTLIQGDIIPVTISKNEISSIPWTDLAGYYPMSVFTYTNTNDMSGNDYQGALRNLDTVDHQTAPLPYETENNGPWTTDATWLNNTVQTLPNDFSIVDGTTPIDWNIVETNHNITIDTDASLGRERSVLGLVVNSNELIIDGLTTSGTGNALTVTHYLELNGSIDLEGESQLIQSDNSVLVVGASGDLERDQQGTADIYTYNYWASPVGTSNVSATNDTYESSYTLPSILSNGTTPSSPGAITFLTSGYDGSDSPFSIADYWIWKFANKENGNYSLWQHMRSTGTILPGEGYTMKGPGSGPITADQNYVFNGKPNNGDITLNISADNNYLVGNPYPSAISATTFINDNPDTNGSLYFWEHWGGGSHYLVDYQGGYAIRNLGGGTPAPSHPDLVDQTGSGTKTPGAFIPVSQGFFVYSAGGGTINFENDQRVFEKDDATGDDSVFMKSSSNASTNTQYQDNRMKIRMGFDSFNGIHRQLLLTKDENASIDIDWGYDADHRGDQIDDMYWMINNEQFIIQGTNIVDTESVFPLGIKTQDNGNNSISIDQLENVPDNLEIYLYDSELNIYHDLRQSDYQVYLNSGEHNSRFNIVFATPGTLDTVDNALSKVLQVFYNNDTENITILNPTLLELENFELFNILGQSVLYIDEIETETQTDIKISNLSSGAYIINLDTSKAKISKKVLVN